MIRALTTIGGTLIAVTAACLAAIGAACIMRGDMPAGLLCVLGAAYMGGQSDLAPERRRA